MRLGGPNRFVMVIKKQKLLEIIYIFFVEKFMPLTGLSLSGEVVSSCFLLMGSQIQIRGLMSSLQESLC